MGDALLVATQGYLPPQYDRALSTKLCHFPGSKRSHWKMQLKSQRPLLTTWRCPTLSGKSSMHVTSASSLTAPGSTLLLHGLLSA